MKSRRIAITLSLAMASISWLGLAYLMYYYPPGNAERVLFLSLLFLATSFTAAPLILAIHRRLARNAKDEMRRQGVVWREAGLLGLYCGLCTWLRFSRLLNWANALLLLAVFILTEALLLARE